MTVPNSDVELAKARALRLKTDPRFAIENLYVVWDQQHRQMAPLRFNEAQIKLQHEIEWFQKSQLPVRLWILKSRRAGMSTGCEAYIYWDTTFHPNTNSLIVANQSKPAENVLKMCRNFWLNTPQDFKPALPPEYRNNPPKDRFEFADINSNIYIATAKSLEQYLSFGFQNMHATEVARYQRGEELFTALYPTLSNTKNTMFFGESTAMGQGNFFHEQCMRAFESRGRAAGGFGQFRLLFIPWWEMTHSFALAFSSMEKRAEFERSLDSQERDLRKKFPISLEQIQWRRAMIAGPPFNGDEELFDQEYPTDVESAFLSTGHSVFSHKDIKRLATNNKREPDWEGDIYWGESSRKNQLENDYDIVRRPQFLTKGDAMERFDCNDVRGNWRNLRMWRWPRKGERIVIGGDVAGGNPNTKGGGDDSTLSIVVCNDLGQRHELIGVWQGQCNPLHFAALASALSWGIAARTGHDTMPLLALEWNGPGVACNTYLDNKQLYTKTFRYFAPGVHRQPSSKHIGWESNSKTKPIMVATLMRWVEQDDIDIPDAATIMQMASYRQASFMGEDTWGSEGTHDDLVSSLQIACACIRMGRVAGEPQSVVDLDSLPDDDDDVESFDPFEHRAGFREDDGDDEDEDEVF